MIDFKDYTNVELRRLANEIEVELQERTHYKNLVQNVLNTINEIDDLNKIACCDCFHDWTWEELANSIKTYNLTNRFKERGLTK